MKKVPVILIGVLAFYALFRYLPVQVNPQADQTDPGASRIEEAFHNRQSNLQVRDSGVVIKLLPDDTVGNRHQRFILRLSSGQTLLVSHNIDLAPRIDNLSEGDAVEFYGEYEWNAKGGMIHWTHHDPDRRHEDGWLKHRGRIYQ